MSSAPDVRLFRTHHLDLAAIIHATHQLQLVAVKGSKASLCWIFSDPRGRGDWFKHHFETGFLEFDWEDLPFARAALLRSKHHIRTAANGGAHV